MKRWRGWFVVGLVGAAFIVVAHQAPSVCADTCTFVSVVGVDTSQADHNSHVGVRCGEAPGETFVATDTLVRSITVWRAAIETPHDGGFKLWITKVDSAGIPQRDQAVLEGPVKYFPLGDGVHPIKMQFSFDPPFALPAPGRYFFAVQDYCGTTWDLLVNLEDAYPDGSLWRGAITCFDGCGYLGNPDIITSWDLIFAIEFCKEIPTPVRTTSWGRLKTIYR